MPISVNCARPEYDDGDSGASLDCCWLDPCSAAAGTPAGPRNAAGIQLLPIVLLVRICARRADAGHERRDDAPAHARPRKPPAHPVVLVLCPFALRRRIPSPPVSLVPCPWKPPLMNVPHDTATRRAHPNHTCGSSRSSVRARGKIIRLRKGASRCASRPSAPTVSCHRVGDCARDFTPTQRPLAVLLLGPARYQRPRRPFSNHGYSDIRVLVVLNPIFRIRPYFGFPRPVSTTDLSRIFSFPDPETNQAADAAAPAATAMDSCRAHRHRSRARTQRSQRSKARQNPGYACPPYPARPAHSRASPIAIHGTLAQHVEPCAASAFLHQ
ncbi:hypothetical protein C8J57DRAFT_1730859 [Mycena rebaudengoi]|nr:hypothetical protein C8J57DRAFT_1730859 [Mycena rebaudengoi]